MRILHPFFPIQTVFSFFSLVVFNSVLVQDQQAPLEHERRGWNLIYWNVTTSEDSQLVMAGVQSFYGDNDLLVHSLICI